MNENKFEWTDELVFKFTDFWDEYQKTHIVSWTSVAVQEFKNKNNFITLKQVVDDYNASKQELDYEITDWDLSKSGIGVLSCMNNNYDCLIKQGAIIKSVRRKSDGEVFTIGDKVDGMRSVTGFKIIKKDDCSGWSEGLHILGELTYHAAIYTCEKVKKPIPLFTTEDGVELFDRMHKIFAIKKTNPFELFKGHNGETLGVWLNGWYTTNWLQNPCEYDTRIVPLIKEHYLLFSTEAAAKEYILMNKPCISVKDIAALYSIDSDTKNQLKELAQKKINGI